MPQNDPDTAPPAVYLLRGGAAVFAVIGISLSIWLADKALRHPEIQATQFDFEAPLWIPALVFVLVAMASGIFVLLRAARRVESGENLFAQRHRRHPSYDEDDPSA